MEDTVAIQDTTINQDTTPNSDRKPNPKRLGLVLRTWWDQESDNEDSDEEDEDDEMRQFKKVPEGHALVSFLDGSPLHFRKEETLVCVDRAMCHGDIVRLKDQPSTEQSGTVIRARMMVDLKHVITGEHLLNVDASLLQYMHDVEEPVCNGSLKNFERGVWLNGEFSRKNKTGIILQNKTEQLRVNWSLYHSLKTAADDQSMDPPDEIVDFSMVQVLPSHFEFASYQIGDRVVFRDPANYDRFPPFQWNVSLPGLDADCRRCMTIVGTRTFVDIEWQDGTVTNDVPSINTVPCLHLDDQDLWPTDYVVLKKEEEDGEKPKDERVGVVLSVQSKERLSKVRWFDDGMDKLEEPVEEYSLYEVTTHPDMQFRIGQKVVLSYTNEHDKPSDTDSWFGEVLGIEKDGMVHVKFCQTGKEGPFTPKRLVVVDQDEDGPYAGDDEEEEDSEWEDMDEGEEGWA
ncbi:hypothetical protein HK097_006647, partial [Rhizophlyctis rosea]